MIGVTQLLAASLIPMTTPNISGLVSGAVFHVDAGFYSSSTWDCLVTGASAAVPSGWSHTAWDGTSGGYFSTGTALGTSFGTNTSWTHSSGNYTAEAWVQFDNANHTYNSAISQNVSASDRGWGITTDQVGNIAGGFVSSNSYYARNYSVSPAANTWYHIVAAIGGGTAIIYINNSGASSNFTLDTTDFGTNHPVVIGNLYTGNTSSSFTLRGKIACARLYRKKLSAAEVAQNYNAQKVRFGY